MSFSSWLFGDDNKSNANQGHTSSNDAEVNSHAHYVTPMGGRSDTYGCSFNSHGNFEPGRSSFHFGAPTHENSNQFRGHENFEPGRSSYSFHFGEQSHHYGTPFVAQFQRGQSTSSFGYTFNVLAVADFNLCFTFAVSGYEGSMHDYQIFKEETAKRGNRYPHPPAGKYYLVDAGYPNAKGYMAPYKGFMYHYDHFRQRRVPITDSNERFTKVHSSLRSCVERAFGVLKKRFRFLKIAIQYDFQEAKKIILIAMGLHNYIRMHYPSNEYFKDAELGNESYVFEDRTSRDIRQEYMRSAPEFAQTDREMNLFHDGIRDRIALDYSQGWNQCSRAS